MVNDEELNLTESEPVAEKPVEEPELTPASADNAAVADNATSADEVDVESPADPMQEAVETADIDSGESVAEAPKPVDDSEIVEPVPETTEATNNEPDEPTGQVVKSSVEDGRAWYVIHCYSGYENKVRFNLEQRIDTMGMKDRIFDVVIPTQEEIEVKEGKRRSIERYVFPGYVLINLILSEESWYVVRNTPGVTGFVGMGNEPTPLRPEEVQQILKRMEAEAPHVRVSFKLEERVRVIDGPFNDFRGTVSDIDMDRAKVTVMVNFFGRETPVELDFLQVEKS